MFSYKVFDDFIGHEDQAKIMNFSKGVDWKYNENISGVFNVRTLEHSDLSFAKDQSGMFYNLYPSDEENIDICNSLIQSLKNALPIDFEIVRVRMGKFIKNPEGGIHAPHVDYYFPHYTLLYYVNDSDGDTFIFNELAESVYPPNVPRYPDTFTVDTSVSPKAGRAILFNGLRYHCSSLNTKSENRIAININVKPKWESIQL